MNTSLVFSAYHEERFSDWIKLIGLSLASPRKHFCQLWYRDVVSTTLRDSITITQMLAVEASFVMLHASDKKYTSCFIKCLLPDNRLPHAVSLVNESDACAIADNVVEIKRSPNEEHTRKFTVCLSPLNFRYGRAYELVEWIELNRILGADRFVVYNYSSASNVGAVLDYYSNLGIVKVVQWPLPIPVNTWPRTGDPVHVHYFAQTAALNDCLLRSESEYVVNVDLDEFIIPHSGALTWDEMIRNITPSGAYIIPSSYFRKEWDTRTEFPKKLEAERYQLVTLLKLEREKYIWLPGERSKYIARRSAVQILLTHVVFGLLPGQRAQVVPPGTCLVHHYRNWLRYNDTVSRVADFTVLEKYQDDLVGRVTAIWSKLRGVELDLPISV